jgi:hypothetical protein
MQVARQALRAGFAGQANVRLIGISMQEMTHRISHELDLLAYEHHDNCINCGYKFKEADTAHLGYDVNGSPQYVCDSCSYLLVETAVRYYFSPNPYDKPNNDSVLWRYMDFTKYVNMLDSSCLFFSRSDLFDDKFEGAKGLVKNIEKWNEHYISFFKEAIKNPPKGYTCDKTTDEVNQEANDLLEQMKSGGINQRKRAFINCWHENEFESEAMWHLYSNYLENAIAIKSTYKKLYESLGKNTAVQIGKVKYIDFTKYYAGINDCFWYKRKSFEHEREVRAITYCDKNFTNGKLIECNLNMLINTVVISPYAKNWFTDLVKNVTTKYGYTFSVLQSNLIDEPFY